jgi:hypothetical protein
VQVVLILGQVSTPAVIPSDFFTPASFGSFISLAGITYVVTNAFRLALNFNPRWFGLAVAIVVTEFGAFLSGASDFTTYLLAILNGCLVFLTAAGGASATNSLTPGGAAAQAHPEAQGEKRGFFAPWF